jgi:iron complex transport system ATP-binding protein
MLPQLVAFVESRFNGIPFLTLKDYISLGRSPHTNAFGRLKESDTQKTLEVMTLLNITDYQDKFTDELSDGIRQLGAIARALVQEAPVLLLDEPTAFLDFENKDLLMKTLKEIAVSQNKCIICSSHDLDLSIELALPTLAVSSKENKLVLVDFPQNKQEIIGLIC